MALTDTAIKNAKSREKPYKMGDSLGLFLLIQPSGGKLWRLKYRRDGKEQKLALGAYPEVSLKDARERRDKARAQLAQGLDPSREKKREAALKRVSAENTFELVAREYFEKRRNDGDTPWSWALAVDRSIMHPHRDRIRRTRCDRDRWGWTLAEDRGYADSRAFQAEYHGEAWPADQIWIADFPPK